MSAVTKGLLAGLTNLIVCGLALGLDEGHIISVMGIVLVIGVAPALLVGALTGWIGGRLPAYRPLVMAWLPLTVVVTLGVLSEPSLIGPAILPTLIGSLVLERWTRPNLAAYRPSPNPPSALTIGALIGAANVVVIACLLAIYVTRIAPRHSISGISIHPPFGLHFAALVTCLGAVPGLIVGAISGFLAQRLRDHGLLTRLAGIGSVAVSGVFAIASLTDTAMLAVPALMPTLFAVAILERLTRRIEVIPPARLHRHA